MEKSGDEKIGFGGNVNGTLKTPQRKIRMKRPSVVMMSLSAPAKFWSPWIEVYAVIGLDKNSQTTVPMLLQSTSGNPSSFDYEIKGGDRFIRGVVAGSGVTEKITITGEVMTSISVRLKSHSITQKVTVRVN